MTDTELPIVRELREENARLRGLLERYGRRAEVLVRSWDDTSGRWIEGDESRLIRDVAAGREDFAAPSEDAPSPVDPAARAAEGATDEG